MSRKTTIVRPAASNLWRGTAWSVAIIVATTAGMARQEIVAEEVGPKTEDVGPKVETVRLTPQVPEAAPKPPDVITIALHQTGTIRRVAVTAGQRVVAGQTMVEVDFDPTAADQALGPLELARATTDASRIEHSLEALDESIRSLTITLADQKARVLMAQREADKFSTRRAPDSLQRTQTAYNEAIAYERKVGELITAGEAGLQQLEEAQVAVRVAAEDLRVARRSAQAEEALHLLQIEQARLEAQLALTHQERDRFDAQLARARAQQAQAAAAMARDASSEADSRISAPRDGVVADVFVMPGYRASSGTPVLTLHADSASR